VLLPRLALLPSWGRLLRRPPPRRAVTPSVRTREADLDELMARLTRGDRTAFDGLYAALRPRAMRLVAIRLGEHRAADVAQSALTKVFANASDFEAGRPCLPWFYAIVANEIRSARRSEARLVATELHDDALVDPYHAEAQMVDRELERALDVAIDALDADAANAIRALLGRQPLPDLPPPTFRKRVSRAYTKLRILLGGHDAN
jgi:DNA-directed RNA polymerase specialized sigma24 family protein